MTRFTRGDQRQRSLHVTIGLLTVVVGTIIALSGVGRSLAANNMGTMRSTATASKMGHTGISAADRHFAIAAAQGGAAEVALGRLAQRNGSNSNVKEFGGKMITDHSNANQDLLRTAATLGLKLPTTPGPQDVKVIAKLTRLHGAAFDSAYRANMVKDHEKDVAEFQSESRFGKVPAIRQFAARTLPILQGHLQMARTMTTSKAYAHHMMKSPMSKGMSQSTTKPGWHL